MVRELSHQYLTEKLNRPWIKHSKTHNHRLAIVLFHSKPHLLFTISLYNNFKIGGMKLTWLLAWTHYKHIPYTYVVLCNGYIKSHYKTWHCWNHIEFVNYQYGNYFLLNLHLTEQFVQDDNNGFNVPILEIQFCFYQVPLHPQTQRNTTLWRRPGGGYFPWTLGGARSVLA